MAKGTLGYKVRTISCAGCGREHTGHLRPTQRFCSHACYRTAPKPERRGAVDTPCEWCGDMFYAPPSQNARFCSRKCTDAWQGRNRVKFTCKTCDEPFTWSPSRLRDNNPTYCTITCRDADPEVRARLLAMNAAQQLVSPTSVEAIGYAILDAIGVEYEPQVVIGGKFAVDAAIHGHRLIIEFDGDYWHDRAGTSTEPRVLRRVELDRSQRAYAETAGWTVLHLWEHDLRTRQDWCEAQIRQRLHPPSPARP